MTNDPKNPEYNAKARDAIMDLCPFYDPNHKCGIVREHVFRDCLTEMRERERIALESTRRLDALSSAGMAKILELESKLAAARLAQDVLPLHTTNATAQTPPDSGTENHG